MMTCTQKAKAFFHKSIVPELLGKFFSRTASGPIDATTDIAMDKTAVMMNLSKLEMHIANVMGLKYHQWLDVKLNFALPMFANRWTCCPDCRKLPNIENI